MDQIQYTEENIRSLSWREHIRVRPGMYIGKLGDGSSPEDGIYVMIKEIIDNCVDEHIMGFGDKIEVVVDGRQVTVRDYGRGIPLGKVVDCVGKINTGGKYDSRAFKKSVGLNGVGGKVVNALSGYFMVASIRQGQQKLAEFERGDLARDHQVRTTGDADGTEVRFVPDSEIFKHFRFIPEYIAKQIWNYAYLNSGLTIVFNGQKYRSRRGLFDLLTHKTSQESLSYPIIHLKGQDIEVALTHGNQYGEQYYSFVNGQFTVQGGTHLAAFREAVVKAVRIFFKKQFEPVDIRQAIIASLSIRIEEPVFESQTKTRLSSSHIAPEGATVRTFVNDFLGRELDDYLHKTPEIAQAMLKRILQSEKERKEMAGVRKIANQRAKKASLHNKKLRDCRVHLTDNNDDRRYDSTLFITEGDSASGSITKARDVQTQAVFSLRGKPLNCYGLPRKVVYQNEELNLLHHALDLEDGLETLRFNNVVVATDADVDGMHIRLLLLTFFLRFFPELVRSGHLYILETPLFRVRNNKQTCYCYSEAEKKAALKRLGAGAEITRFKGLGEISPHEFARLIGEDIKLEPVIVDEASAIGKTLEYYMGKNSPERQQFVIENLRSEREQQL